jgi:hypothetical protein
MWRADTEAIQGNGSAVHPLSVEVTVTHRCSRSGSAERRAVRLWSFRLSLINHRAAYGRFVSFDG